MVFSGCLVVCVVFFSVIVVLSVSCVLVVLMVVSG